MENKKNKKKMWEKPKIKEIKIDKQGYIYGQCEKDSFIAGCPGFIYYT